MSEKLPKWLELSEILRIFARRSVRYSAAPQPLGDEGDACLSKNSRVLDCVRFARALQRQIDNMCNFKISRLWETQDSKKLKIVLNFQDCLVVSNFIPTFAMSNRREKAKAKSQVLYNQQRREEVKPIQKEKMIYEGGKFCLDMAKLILGGVVLGSVMQQNVNVWLLVSIGLGAVMAFVVFGFILIGKIKNN